ncbi:MAG TPA: hypothetical protein VMS31_05610, partial [Pyrinomonadaceae bacterium]|nr:hypothetical protein [Pyrinomonadaceae bacterium]
ALQQRAKAPKFSFVRSKTGIGQGANRLEIYPVRGSGGERMMLVYFPELKVLYGSDLVQPDRNGGFFSPQYLSEVAEIVNSEKLEVDRVYAMHLDATPWTKVVEALNRAMLPTSSNGN